MCLATYYFSGIDIMFGRPVSDAHSHFLLVLFAAGQFALLVQEVDEAHQQ